MYNNLISFDTNALTKMIKQAVREELEKIINQQNVKQSIETTYTRKETAEKLKISLATLSRWTAQGKITSRGIGTRVYYTLNDIDKAMISIK